MNQSKMDISAPLPVSDKANEYLLTNQRSDQPVCGQNTNVSLKIAFPPHN